MAKKDAPMMLTQSKVKELTKSLGVNCSSDFITGLNESVSGLVESTVKRTKSNNRKTVRGDDV